MRLSLALLALAFAPAGCGASAEFIAPKDPRTPLKKGFHTTYLFKYILKRNGFLGGLFGRRSISKPRLLYAERETEFEREPEAFHDTGAPFDQGARTIEWRIPNVRKLWGKTLFFAIDGNNLSGGSLLAVPFPRPGRILSVEPVQSGRTVRFAVKHMEKIFNLKFFARFGRGRKQLIRPEEGPSPSEGIRVFEWDPTRDLAPEDSRLPLSFSVEYEDWYYERAPKPHITSAVRIPRAVEFASPVHQPDGKLRLPFRLWGKLGIMTFDYKSAGNEWQTARNLRVQEGMSGERTVVWDLQKEGLAPLNRSVRLRARSFEEELGSCEILPPKPGIKVLSIRQEGNVVFILFEAVFVPPKEVRLFAGSGKYQRLVLPGEFVKRSEGLLAFRIDRLPVQMGPRGGKILYVFLSAQNPAGSAGTEVKIPLVTLAFQAIRQVEGEIEVDAEFPDGGSAPTLFYRARGSKDWKPASRLLVEKGRFRWAFLKEFGGRVPEEIELRLTAIRGDSSGLVEARIAPLVVVPGRLRELGNGRLELDVEVHGCPDWVLFEFNLGGRGFRAARGARFDREAGRLSWSFWDDVPREEYEGETAVLRAAFRNPWGFYTVTVQDVRPCFVRLGAPETVEGSVRIPIRFREGMNLSFFVSKDLGRSFRPLKGGRVEGGKLVFDLDALGPLAGNRIKVRAAATGAGGEKVEADASIHLPAGIDKDRAYWHQGLLWIRYEVDWRISEKDVRAEVYIEGPEARAPIWEEASVPVWKVFDVNRRGFAWDVARDMARGGTRDPARIHLRLVIHEEQIGKIVREVSLRDLPSPPLTPMAPKMGLQNGALTFSLGGVKAPPGAPPFSLRNYNVHLEYIDPSTTHFKRARLDRRITSPDRYAWARDQALNAVGRGTWVKVVVTLKGNNRITGFALFDMRLDRDHPFFTGEKDDEDF